MLVETGQVKKSDASQKFFVFTFSLIFTNYSLLCIGKGKSNE